MEVKDGLVDEVILFASGHWFWRYDVFPFVVVYAILFSMALCSPDANAVLLTSQFSTSLSLESLQSALSAKMFGLIGLPLVLAVHLFLFLMAQNSALLRCRLGNRQVSLVSAADCVFVRAAKNSGKDRIARLRRSPLSGSVTVAGNKFDVAGEIFEFQKVTYSYDASKGTFTRLTYPSHGAVTKFLESPGVQTKVDLATSQQKWGKNEFDIPIPGFLDLYVEHLVAPFFVFQVLCLFLWSLDDYWYYSLLTLFMLMFFEGMLCRQRQNSLKMLRQMRKRPYNIFIHREGEWEECLSNEIVPGDVISLTTALPTALRGGRGRGRGRGRDWEDGEGEDGGEGHDERVVPCDVLIIRGSCVVNEAMLTGESVPQLKESLRNADDRDTAIVNLGADTAGIDAQWKRHLVFGGTTLLQHSEVEDGKDGSGVGGTQSSLSNNILSPPDRGCVAVAVRTGYGTSQGGLMRKILFATERVTSNSSETFYFIGALVVFAFIASAVVLHGGLQDETRNRFKLVLHCIMIITSVVPPELPMELSLAVTNSLAALSMGLVFCTEPFRIPFAGKLDVLCFDKTGTLTKDKMVLKGAVIGPAASTDNTSSSDAGDAVTEVVKPSECSDTLVSAMGACHSLMISKKGGVGAAQVVAILGDPLEKATMEASGFQFVDPSGNIIVSQDRKVLIKIKHRYPFSSALKRMSVVVESQKIIEDDGSAGGDTIGGVPSLSAPTLLILTKGAPEILEERLKSVPPFYRSTYLYHMNRGKRVLVVASKTLSIDAKYGGNVPRSNIECDLEFAGFLIFDCDLKPDSKSVIRELRASNHKVVMITGDSAYTAADVAKRVGMLKEASAGVLILEQRSVSKNASNNRENELVWTSVGQSATTAEGGDSKTTDDVVKFNADQSTASQTAASLASSHLLCVTGAALSQLVTLKEGKAIFQALCPHVTIFARVSPAQKELIVLALNESGLYTLMCGDGTNDVGALKAAHVGVSIVNDPELEGRIEGVDVSDGSNAKGSGGKKPKGQSAKERMARAMAELNEQERDPTIVKLGDASIASPFTARRTSIDSVLTVLRQGRCTLITTIQVFKILALNCLVSAYMMSALYLRGLKQGDLQMTASGLITAALFFFLSQAKPLTRIAPNKPPSSAFSLSVSLSIVGQFIVHLSCLIATLALCEQHSGSSGNGKGGGISSNGVGMSTADGKFHPNVINTAVYLLSSTMQINNFVVNYRGNPFTQSIQENVMLYGCVRVIYLILLVLVGGQVDPLNDFLQLAPFPNSTFQAWLVCILAFNLGACFGIEKLCQRLE